MVSNGATVRDFPTFANLRCGKWYLPHFDGECYFKSTDGHYGEWAFNMSRLNLHLFQAAASAGGAVVVDSTRKGKVFPDSLSKTLPIVATVLNVCLGHATPEQWSQGLPAFLPASERVAIMERVPVWASTLQSSSVNLSGLQTAVGGRPFACYWITRKDVAPGAVGMQLEVDPAVIGLYLVSASDNLRETRELDRTQWSYVPGAGDDEEAWSRGLSPAMFWAEPEKYLKHNSCVELMEAVDSVVQYEKESRRPTDHQRSPVILQPFGLIVVCSEDMLGPSETEGKHPSGCPVVHCNATALTFDDTLSPPRLCIAAREESKFDFERALPSLLDSLAKYTPLRNVYIVSGANPPLALALAVALTVHYCCDPEMRRSKNGVSDVYAQVAAQLPWIRGCRNLRKQINRFFLT